MKLGGKSMIDISNIKKRTNRCKATNISLCGKLEAFVGNYYLANVFPESRVEILYYDASVGIYDAIDTIEKNIVAFFVDDESIGFVKSDYLEKLQQETEEYCITYFSVDDFTKEQLCVDLSRKLPEYLKDILWVNDDFLTDETIPFDYDAFEIIDGNADYLNPAHFSVLQLLRELNKFNCKCKEVDVCT